MLRDWGRKYFVKILNVFNVSEIKSLLIIYIYIYIIKRKINGSSIVTTI